MRSLNMARLTSQLQALYPGMTIYGIGDAAHKLSPSGHNEDDTPGSKPEQEDPDSKPEHRAIDAMLTAGFTYAAAAAIVTLMVTLEANRQRLLYVIFDGYIWRRNGGWVKEVYGGPDKHRDHVHFSGNWPDDDNTTDWIVVPPVVPIVPKRGMHDMILIHKIAAGRAVFALLAADGVVQEWKDTDTITTPTGTIGGQALANAWAESLGDSTQKTEIEYAAMVAAVTTHGSVR